MIAPTKILRDESQAARHWLLLPSDLRKWGQALLHQQCWCWGQDIKRRAGNLLIEQGFARTRPPEGHKGSPTYALRLDERRCVALWGFGMCFCDAEQGSVFLSRYGFAPRFRARCETPQEVWKPEHLHDFHAPRTPHQCQQSLQLLGAALCWLGDYERAVLDSHGLGYRCETLEQWSHTVLPPQQVPGEWARLSTWCLQRAAIRTRDLNGVRQTLARHFVC